MRPIDDILYDLKRHELVLEVAMSDYKALEREYMAAEKVIFDREVGEFTGDIPILRDMVMKKNGHGRPKERFCSCSYSKGGLIINPKCKEHGLLNKHESPR